MKKKKLNHDFMEKRLYTFRIIIEPDEPQGYHGFAPLLRGLHTTGNTIEETRKNLREAIRCHIQGLAKDHEPIPREEDALEFIQSFSDRELLRTRP